MGSRDIDVQYWLKPEQVSGEIYVHSRSFFSKFESSSIEDYARIEELIYGEHIYISKKELRDIINATLSAFDFEPYGVGLELGAGCAAVSVEIANYFPNVSKIYLF